MDEVIVPEGEFVDGVVVEPALPLLEVPVEVLPEEENGGVLEVKVSEEIASGDGLA